jgi:hypothetical protein
MTDPKKLREALEKLKNAVAKAKVTKSLHVQAEIAEVCETADEYLEALTGDGEPCDHRWDGCLKSDEPIRCLICRAPKVIEQPPQPDAAGTHGFMTIDDHGTMKMDIFGWLRTPQGQKSLQRHTSIKIPRPPRTEGVEPYFVEAEDANHKTWGVLDQHGDTIIGELSCDGFAEQMAKALNDAHFAGQASAGMYDEADDPLPTEALPIAAPGDVENLKREVNHALAKPYPSINGDSIRNEVIDHLAKRGLIAGVKKDE